MKKLVTTLSFLILICNILISCSTKPKLTDKNMPQEKNSLVGLTNVEIINTSYDYLQAGKCEDAQKGFEFYLKENKFSPLRAQAKLGLAQSFDCLEKYSDAQIHYREIYTTYVGINNEIAAHALYLASYSYEQSGDDFRSLSALHDAKRYTSFFRHESVKAELSARLAIIYAKLKKYTEAQKYLAEADREINKLKEQKGASSEGEWLAKAYFQMGSVSTSQISMDSISAVIRGQKMVQNYLIKSMALGVSPWSERSTQKAIANYRDIWTVIQSASHATGIEASTGLRVVREFQIQKGGELLDLLETAELLKPLNEALMSASQREYYNYVNLLKAEIMSTLYKSEETTILTQESQKLNQIKKEAKTQPDIFFRPMMGEEN